MRRMIAIAVLSVAAGCGRHGGFSFAEVTGRVTLNGRPVEGALLRFEPERPPAVPAETPLPIAYGKTDADGRYRAFRTGTRLFGTGVGRNRVSITPPDEGNVKLPTTAENGSLACDVKPGANTFDIDLKSGK